jgi:cyclomaltodextrinase / maltogenic alpha-amylase / neopullulanase
MKSQSIRALLLLTSIIFVSCSNQGTDPSHVSQPLGHAEWSRNAVIYELNVRQFTDEGTFSAAIEWIPELRDMGVGIIWLMPIHPIGELNRKGSLGSYYSVRDYKGINPEFGTEDDFRLFVTAAHNLGMKVIIDWVANHTAWDHPWTISNPEWYTKNDQGEFIPPVDDWSDVIDLNFENADLREAMIDALEYWVREFDIDGYRCDVADMVPIDFWETARARLDAIKPVFMLAEAETPALHAKAFDMGYAWEMHHIMNRVAQGAPLAKLDSMIEVTRSKFPTNSWLMNFTSNHDENSWNGTEFERMGDGAVAFAVLSGTMEGMPLIYNGQEVGMNKRLAFFDKDPIVWTESPMFNIYTRLNLLKRNNPALWNGNHGAPMQRFETENDRVYAFHRTKDVYSVVVVINMSADSARVSLTTDNLQYTYKDIFNDSIFEMSPIFNTNLGPWDYKVYARVQN